MKAIYFINFFFTGFVALFLMLWGIEVNGGNYERFAEWLFAPGIWVAQTIFPPDAQSTVYTWISFGLNLVYIWGILLLLLVVLEKILFRSRGKS